MIAMNVGGATGSRRKRKRKRIHSNSVRGCPATQVHKSRGTMSTTVTLRVDGMTCNSCVRKVELALTKSPAVESAEVDLAASRAVIRSTLSENQLINIINEAGV